MKEIPLISIITISLNSSTHIERAIKSVFSQTYPRIEYLVIDGGSTDGTLDIIAGYRDRIHYFVSEPDSGIYNAMNKGIAATGGDVLFFLNSDDYFADQKVVEDAAKAFVDNPDVDIVFGDQVFDLGDRTFTKKQSFEVTREQLAETTVQHQTVFAKRGVFQLTGGFSEEYKIVSDFEWMLKVFVDHKCRYHYIKRPITVMATSGLSWNTPYEEERIRVMKKYYSCEEILDWRALPVIRQKDALIKKLGEELAGKNMPLKDSKLIWQQKVFKALQLLLRRNKTL
jgi:glycosyltransferase involved in cell wall biosynthesis